jgi:deoxyadenosine/deoxycytidine kinase
MSLDIDFTQQQAKFQKVLEIFKSPNKKFIVVDGVISAGKTTLIKLLENKINSEFQANREDQANGESENKLKIKAIYEPVDLWNSTGTLQYFYEDIPKNCYEFQTYTYITRIASVINEIYDNPDADIYILERSIWTDRYIFMELLKEMVGELRMTMYNHWCELWSYIMPMRVDKWVLLNTSLDESIRRIKNRNRTAENGISVEYQTNLYKKHIEFYNNLQKTGKSVVIINNELMDANFINDDSILTNIVSQIMAF